MNDIKERVVSLLMSKKLSVNRASKMFGIPQRTLNRQVNEDGKIGMELLYAIMDYFPEISPAWLLLGEGEMLRDEMAALPNVPFYSDLPVLGMHTTLPRRNRPDTYPCRRKGLNAISLWWGHQWNPKSTKVI